MPQKSNVKYLNYILALHINTYGAALNISKYGTEIPIATSKDD